jgi:PEGA domain
MRQLAKLLSWKFRLRGFESRPHRHAPPAPGFAGTRAPAGGREVGFRGSRLLALVADSRDRGLTLLVLACAATGCAVDRRLRIETEPAGAEVIVDGRAVGHAPLDVHYEHYGTRRVRVEMRDLEPREVLVTLEAPWYGAFPIDFVTEILVPVWRTDYRKVRLDLVPKRPPEVQAPDEERRITEAALEHGKTLRHWVPGEALPPGAGPAARPEPPTVEAVPFELP